MKAVIYVRVSTEEQKKKGYSIDAQIDRCIEFAKREGYDDVTIFKEEGKSAKTLHRPVLQEMLVFIKKHYKDIDAIIFWKWDRLSRGEDADYVELGIFFNKYGITPLSVEENNETTPEAKLMRKITRATSAYELDKDSQRTKLGMQRKADEGYPPFKAPIGYINEKNALGKRTFIIDEQNAFFVKRAFNLYNTSMYTLKSLGLELFKIGFKNKYGKPYPARKFEEILKNKNYTGDFVWNGRTYKGNYKAIISKELYYSVQEKLGYINKPKQEQHEHTYQRLIRCAKCGCLVSPDGQHGSHNSGNYTYYSCNNKKNMHPKRPPRITEQQIDEAVQEIINSIHIPDGVFEIMKENIYKSLDEMYKIENTTSAYRNNKIKELETLIKRNHESIMLRNIPKGMTEEGILKNIEEYSEELDKLLISAKESNEINKNIYKNINLLLHYCHNIPTLYLEAPIKEKQLMLRTFIDTIEYYDGKLTAKLKPIFDFLRKLKNSNVLEINGLKGRTHENHSNSEIAEILTKNISDSLKIKGRTLKTLIVPNKKAPEGANSLNGASDKGIIELFGEDNMPILLPDTGMYTYKNLICIMKQCTQTYYNIRKVLGFECA